MLPKSFLHLISKNQQAKYVPLIIIYVNQNDDAKEN